MRCMLTGASGLVGTALERHLASRGDDVVALRRQVEGEHQRLEPVPGCDAIVHLAGENIAGGRWTAARKRRLRDSRVPLTRQLAESLAAMADPPRVLISASAVGIYGDRGGEELDEDSAPGRGFLADLGREWESATRPAADAGIRVVNLRIGVVLSADGGALGKMLLPFKLGLGGRLGDGRMFMSTIHITDLCRAVAYAIDRDTLEGPVLAVGPNPVTNAEFTRALGRALRRPALLPVPGFVLRALFGELAEEALLASQRAHPRRLLEAGFGFDYPTVDAALGDLLAVGT